jgi:hypothetical protein
MLSSFSKFIYHPRLSLVLVQQQRSLASKSSSSTGDTYEKGKKDMHSPKLDASQQSGPKTQQERSEWEKKEQGFGSDVETRQERKPQNEKKDTKTKPSKK